MRGKNIIGGPVTRHKLPEEIRALVHARNMLRTRFEHHGLSFTLDGNLVGDLGEAVAAELFHLTLVPTRAFKAVDAYDTENRSVQIKASGRGKTFAFTHSELCADRLIALVFDYENEEVEVVYDGEYRAAISRLPDTWDGQKSVSVHFLRTLKK